jgi:hypothetical protein
VVHILPPAGTCDGRVIPRRGAETLGFLTMFGIAIENILKFTLVLSVERCDRMISGGHFFGPTSCRSNGTGGDGVGELSKRCAQRLVAR